MRDCGAGSDSDIWLDKQTHLKSELQISLTETKLELLNGLNQCLLLYFFLVQNVLCAKHAKGA